MAAPEGFLSLGPAPLPFIGGAGTDLEQFGKYHSTAFPNFLRDDTVLHQRAGGASA